MKETYIGPNRMLDVVVSFQLLGEMLAFARLVSKAATTRPYLVRQIATTSIRNGKFFADAEDKRLDQHYMDVFNDPNIDGFILRGAMQDLYELDMIPDPDICDAVLRACRRVNDFALAIRFIESLKEKCILKRWTHKWLMDKIKPTMDELGIPTLEEMNYDKPELFVPMSDWWWERKWYKEYGFDKHGYEY
uniref:Cytochrome c oxidase subunit 5A, mitochondrial n=1 Tax=Setaria digitata TaxID=48799 RepID=A0A915PX69_9BILA